MILPGDGHHERPELIAPTPTSNIFGYRFIAFSSSIAIALFGFIVWGHHMFTSAVSPS